MNRTARPTADHADRRITHRTWHRSMSLGLALMVMVGGTACRSNQRISLSEFVKMQQHTREEASRPESEASLELVRSMLAKQLGPYRVGPGDVLEITPTGIESPQLFTPLLARVDRKGAVHLPLVGAVQVADREMEDVEHAIISAYVPAIVKDPLALHVALREPLTTNVFVRGAVETAGISKLRRTERNLLFAIQAADGASLAASGVVTLRRLRRPTETVSLDLTDPKQLRAALALDPLEDGDLVYVHTAPTNTVFVGGLVNAPHPQTYDSGVAVTLLQAIAAAGGLRTDVNPDEGTLIRRMPDGTDVRVKLALNRIEDGRDPNITLAAGDILWVPETIKTRLADFVNRTVFMRAGVTLSYNLSASEFLNSAARSSALGGRGSGGGSLQNSVDPLGFINRGAAIQSLTP